MLSRKPLNYNQITDYLYVGRTPSSKDYAILAKHNVRLVINMRVERFAFPTKARRTIRTIWVPSLDTALTPIRVSKILDAAQLADKVIADGGKVYVYCRAGRHRSVAMATSILISQGHDIDAAISLIKSKRVVADPEIPHIYKVITKFAALWAAR